ncbi:Pre-mRNA-splicing factor SPF27 [Melampsora americana]|nr:Pre-mRNA-splicing factor SPF27 [Melampsora americana]
MSHQISIDSLPYYDRDLDLIPNLRQRVEREIEQEIKRSTSKTQEEEKTNHHSYLNQFPNLINQPKEIYHELLHQSLPSLTNPIQPTDQNDEIKGLDLERLNIPYPNDTNDLSSWKGSLKNSKSQLEQQRNRLMNLKLIQQFGSNHWRLVNFLIEKEIEKLEIELNLKLNQIDRINKNRKSNQIEVGERLNELNQKWQDLISNNISLEIMNLNLTHQIELMKLKEDELKKRLN